MENQAEEKMSDVGCDLENGFKYRTLHTAQCLEFFLVLFRLNLVVHGIPGFKFTIL